MKRIKFTRKRTIRKYRFWLIFLGIAIIFVVISIFQSKRNFEQNRRKRFPVSTVEETLGGDVSNDTTITTVALPEHGNISYEVGGVGESVILLHCWAGARQYWKHTITELLPYYRVYALDLKGFGASDKPERGYQMESFVDMLRDFMDTLDIERAIIIGHSMGGAIAMLFTLNYPGRVTRLVLVALPMSGHRIGHKLIGAPVIGRLWYRIVRFIGKYALREPKARKIWVQPTVASATQSMKAFVHTNPLLRIREINCPVLLIMGKKDPATALASPSTKNTKRIDLKLALIDAARHSPQCENPPEFNQKLLAFLHADESKLIIPARIR